MCNKFYLVLIVVLLSVLSLNAESKSGVTPFQFSIFNPIQIFDENYDVYGCRITIPYGVNASVCGIDAGLYLTTTGDQCGFQSAVVVASREGMTTGVTCAAIANLSKGDEWGVSLAGAFNFATGEITGLQAAGLISHASRFNGLQMAVFNHCDDFKGVQFGLINICKHQTIPFTILLNFRF